MAQKEIAGKTVQVNDEGYMNNSSEWNREIAVAIAVEEGIGDLADGHWKVIDFLQKDFEEKGTIPSLRRLTKAGGVPTKDLYALFPGGPLKKSSKIAGLKKPA
ncbi:MAG: TusE/DsrC/DsvC family sulfur relay protein, partial [Spirochaetales bacterium]|nr:TusE/DsrC/DsvC family sulfur relay protein [Spirochaetales bacterium]